MVPLARVGPMDAFDKIRSRYPDWSFTKLWVSANSGPDFRRLYAERGEVTVSADNETELEAKILRAESRG